MLTPNFKLTQTEASLEVVIRAPFANIADTEVYIDGNEFRFCSSPYYLRLHFPGNVQEATSGCYDADVGKFTFALSKETPGQNFPDLDLIATLLTPRKLVNRSANHLIEVISDKVKADGEGYSGEEEEEGFIEQIPIVECNSLSTSKYGFANTLSGLTKGLQEEFSEVIDLSDVANVSVGERMGLQSAAEDDLFSEEHYLADLMEPSAYSCAYLQFEAPWSELRHNDVQLSEEEQETLKNLGNKEFLLDKNELGTAMLSLADILFAYAYNYRTTLGESTVESAWTINKLSSTLSWLQSFSDIQQVAISCFRRALIFPICRHWDLAELVLQDTVQILALGRRFVLKCLLEIYHLFNKSEPRYILNQLYIKDYCIWIQQVPKRKVQSLADALKTVSLKKCDVGLDLVDLEAAAFLVQKEEEASEQQLGDKMAALAVTETDSAATDCIASSEDNDSLDSDDISSSSQTTSTWTSDDEPQSSSSEYSSD